MENFRGNKRFANITAAGIMQSPVWRSEHDSLDTRNCRVYLIAPGNWNNDRGEYSALVCGGGKAIMASLSSCGYEADRKGRWQNVRQ
ncbi:hypothetical protein HYV83_01595 [Candidatus Woesearchaeota archaeon]|nr:hypothetical protein [Candidatus Woesearchaeota archaeon]